MSGLEIRTIKNSFTIEFINCNSILEANNKIANSCISLSFSGLAGCNNETKSHLVYKYTLKLNENAIKPLIDKFEIARGEENKHKFELFFIDHNGNIFREKVCI